TSKVYSVANGALLQTTAPAVANSNSSSAPLILNGAVFFGNASRLEKHTLNAGVLGAATTSNANSAATYFEVITDGTSLYAWRSITNGLSSRNPANLNSNWSRAVTPTGAGVVALNGGNIVVPLATGPVDSFLANNSAGP